MISYNTYNSANRRREFPKLPKDAYVVRLLAAKVQTTRNGNQQLVLPFDIHEGDYKDYYKGVFDRNSNEDKKWPNDGVFRLTVPYQGCPDYVVTNWDTFFADLEDSNNGFRFSGDERALKGKIIGAKMHIEQSEWNGRVYDHVRMRWTCTAEAVRQGKAGKLPNDKLIQPKATEDIGGFVDVPAGSLDTIPFD